MEWDTWQDLSGSHSNPFSFFSSVLSLPHDHTPLIPPHFSILFPPPSAKNSADPPPLSSCIFLLFLLPKTGGPHAPNSWGWGCLLLHFYGLNSWFRGCEGAGFGSSFFLLGWPAVLGEVWSLELEVLAFVGAWLKGSSPPLSFPWQRLCRGLKEAIFFSFLGQKRGEVWWWCGDSFSLHFSP